MWPVPTRNIRLTEHHEKIIDALVRSGRYRNASEVLRDALCLIERREAEDAARLEALREAAQKGIEAFERGDYQSFESFDEMERHLTESSETAIARQRAR